MNYYNKFNSYLNIDVYEDPVVKDTQMLNDVNYQIFIQVSTPPTTSNRPHLNYFSQKGRKFPKRLDNK